MATEVFGNSQVTTLNNGGTLSAGATSCTVTDASTFPATGNFRIVIESEICLVTSRAGNVLTLVRGQESTTAVSHADGLPVTHLFSKGAVQALQQARPRITNTANAIYTCDVTDSVTNVSIWHNKSGAISYVLPAPTDGRHIELRDQTGAIQTLANNVFIVPAAGEKINGSTGFSLSGSAYNFINGSGTATATSSKFLSELAVGMSIASSNQAGVNYIITAIATDLSLTITPTFSGTTTFVATARRTSLTFAANGGVLFIDSDGTDWIVKGNGVPTTVPFTVSGTFIPPAGTYGGTITAAGGGGGGGTGANGSSTVSASTSGAGGGGSVEGTDRVTWTPNTAIAVTIGNGGGGGSGTDGGNGSITTWAALYTYLGASGGPGAFGSAAGNNGGINTIAFSNNYATVQNDISGIGAGMIGLGGRSGAGGNNGSGSVGTVGNNNKKYTGGAIGALGAYTTTLGAPGGSGGGGAGPRGNGGAGGAGGASEASVGATAGNGVAGTAAAANSGAGGGGGGSGGQSTGTAGTRGAGGAGGSGYLDVTYVL